MMTHWMPVRRPALAPLAFGKELDDLFRGVFPLGATGLRPRVDVAETDEAWRFEVELPGLAAEDVEVTLSERVLHISGTKRSQREDSQDEYRLVERSVGSFERSFHLPAAVNEEAVQAAFDKGVLTVLVPKAADGKRRIAITEGS